MKNPQVDKYIENSADFAKPILKHIREVVHKACPEVAETIKWGMPHFDFKGSICGIAAFKAHAVLGFPKESLMKDPYKLFGKKMDAMGSLGRLTDVKQLPSDKILIEYIQEAMQLNIDGKKVTKTKHAKKPIAIPDYFQKVLDTNEVAKERFESLSPSHQREYLEWITEAKTEPTREKRILTTIKWVTEGKSMNWKYER